MVMPSQESIQKMTPMMIQFFELKKKAEDAILLFRMGDFYEIFGDDAIEVAPKLDLTLTSREKGHEGKIPFCGVPHHSARSYWLRLLQMGYRVAIADQVESVSESKGLVRRDITRILTPGCVDELEALESGEPNYLLAVWEEPDSRKVWVCAADMSTAEIRVGSVDSLNHVVPLVEYFRPRELVCRRFVELRMRELLKSFVLEYGLSFGYLPESVLRDTVDQDSLVSSIALSTELEAADLGRWQTIVGGLFAYFESLKAPISQFRRALPLKGAERMEMDEAARRDLELFESSKRRQYAGSFLATVDRTLTPMGGRLFRENLRAPLSKKEDIARRRGMVGCLIENGGLLDSIRLLLKGLPDLQRLTVRAIGGRSLPAELKKILSCLGVGQKLSKEVAGCELSDVLSGLQSGVSLAVHLDRALADEVGSLGSLGVFREGYDEKLDEFRSLTLGGERAVRDYEKSLRDSTGIASLKVKTHKTYGLLIEVTKSNLHKVPPHFVRRQTMVNNERFSTEELQSLEERLAAAQDQALSRESTLYSDLMNTVVSGSEGLMILSKDIGFLDLIQGLSEMAREGEYCCPEFSKTGDLRLIGSRHPVVESFVGTSDFSPNDIVMTNDTRGLFITGPNMAGKSTAMRQTALCAIFHQMGGYVPAREAQMPVFDQIFTRVGASDDLAQGQSTFMVEMSEAAKILRCATKSSLIILDEIGRGTSTEDGMAIAHAILEELVASMGSYFLFATHFHDLVPRVGGMPGIKFVKTEVLNNGSIEFTHRLIDGVASSSYGIEVAKLAGVPLKVIDSANAHLDHILTGKKSDISVDYGVNTTQILPKRHVEVLGKLDLVNLNRTTPLQALNILFDMQSQMHSGLQDGLFEE